MISENFKTKTAWTVIASTVMITVVGSQPKVTAAAIS
ncbi:hypothetical protein HG15A2_29580 [Adhaeretor mobilis]|uniref:Uncharacterized protein n=1 Tax=Adhaeretor mobilis TaxID=1930276 RepID=A0A517MXN4_9BACT|nr:hypothetical protein HG15A2_29580 [Adhaeretor mobilis]